MPDPVLLHEYVPEALGRPVPGEDNTARMNAAIAAVAALDGMQTALWRGTITCDGTLGGKDLSDICVRAERAGDGSQTLTDAGPNPDFTAQNNRAHWRWTNPTNVWLCNMTITGTHDLWEPDRSPDAPHEQDIWEGQTGISTVGGKDSGAVGCAVRNVWGDGFGYGGYSPTRRAQDVRVGDGHTLWNCSLNRNGRVALLMNGVKNFTCDGLDAINFVSSFYHIEVASNPNLAQSNLHLVRGKMRRGQERTAGGRLCTFTSGTDLSDVWIEDNQLIGHALGIHMVARGDSVEERWDRVTIARNVWDRTATSNAMITPWKIDGLSVVNNTGPRDARCKLISAEAKATCTNVFEAGNKIPIVA